MSTDDADAEGDRPEIAEVVPDDFLSTWGASTYKEALERAEQAPTTTPTDEVKRCPTCGTQRVYPRGTDGSAGPPREHDAAYKCARGHRFDDPVCGDPSDLDLDLDDDADEDTQVEEDPFGWIDAEDLAGPPLRRQLRALDDETKTALAIYLYRPWNHTDADPSYRELGYLLGYSRQWVGERVRAWEDGEYRDLVRDPRPRITVNASADAEGVAAE